MKIETVTNEPGDMKLSFYWDSDCQKYDFNKMTSFDIIFILDDQDFCLFDDPDYLQMKINVELPPNTGPYITTTFDSDSVTLKLLNELVEQINGFDDDGDLITLKAEGIGFDLEDAGFSNIDSSGIAEVTSDFSWKLDCYTIDPYIDSVYEVLFIIEDSDKCKITNTDSVMIKFGASIGADHQKSL